MPGMVMNPPIDVTLTIWPRLRSRIPGSTALIIATGPNTFAALPLQVVHDGSTPIAQDDHSWTYIECGRTAVAYGQG